MAIWYGEPHLENGKLVPAGWYNPPVVLGTPLSSTEKAKLEQKGGFFSRMFPSVPSGTTDSAIPTMTNGEIGHAPQSDKFSLKGQDIATTYAASVIKEKSAVTIESSSSSDATTALKDVDTRKIKLLDNVLHAYPSYTYGISLHLLSAKEYNEVVKTQSYIPKHVLIASAGRRDDIGGTFPRSEFFNEDFYFTNLNMTTVIGMNAQSRATNAITVDFSINEPYGITLLNRIIDAAHKLEAANYIDMPYLLQIDFYGINDAGELIGIIPNQTKYIPIKLIKMDIKTSVTGAEYQISAVPFNHSAYDLSTISNPIDVSVTASSVQSFFEELVTDKKIVIDNMNERAEEENRLSQSSLPVTQVDKVRSYTSAINAYHTNIGATHKTTGIDTYTFEFHKDILEAGSFSLTAKNLDIRNTSMANEVTAPTTRQSNAGVNIKLSNFSPDAQTFAINAGTSIDMVLNYVMKSSNFIQFQLKSPEDANNNVSDFSKARKNDQPLQWYKIIPQITLGAYDQVHGTWARTIHYKVIPYIIYNVKTDEAPQGVTETPLKAYNYYHTGNNADILDLAIDFNFMYYTAITSYRNNASKATSVVDDGLSCLAYPISSSDPSVATPLRKKFVVTNVAADSGGGVITAADVTARDTEQALLPNAGADMLNVKLKIIGDPLFIKQDDIFYAPLMTRKGIQVDGDKDDRLTANGSIITDTGEVYVQILFRSPSDIDDITGMMKYDPKYQESVFSGMYRVLTVANSFAGGQFTQTLDLVRLPRQSKHDYTARTQKEQNADRAEYIAAHPFAENAAPLAVNTSSDVVAANSTPAVDTPVNKVDPAQQKLMAMTHVPPVTTTLNEDEKALLQEGIRIRAERYIN